MKIISHFTKNNRLALCLVVVSLLFSCSKKEECPYGKIDYLGNCMYDIMNNAKMSINDTDIEDHVMPLGTLRKEKNIVSVNISSLYVHPESERWEDLIILSLLEIPFEIGKHYGLEIFGYRDEDPKNTFKLIYLNIDALTALLELDPEWEDSYVEITEIDEINQIVKGKFDLKFIKPQKFANTWPPQEAHTTGEFESKYKIWE